MLDLLVRIVLLAIFITCFWFGWMVVGEEIKDWRRERKMAKHDYLKEWDEFRAKMEENDEGR